MENLSEEKAERKELIESIQFMILNGKDSMIQSLLFDYHPADLAEIITEMDENEKMYLFRLFTIEKRSEVLVELNEETQKSIVENLNLTDLSEIIEELESDDIVWLLKEIPVKKSVELLNFINPKQAYKIRKQLNFQENTAGQLMSYDYAVVNENDKALKASQKVRKAARDIENLYVVYVTDNEGVLKGVIKLQDMFLSPASRKISKIMEPIKSIHYNTDQEEVARFFIKYDYVSAPVVDDNEKLIGRLTVDDILDIVEEEAAEDILLMGGISEDEKLSTPIYQSVKKRTSWLHVNLVTAVLAAWVVTFFEDTIQKVVVLASLMPIVAGMGGNAGTQTITLIVRNIATGEVSSHNWYHAVRKEFIVGLFNGLVIGTVTAIIAFIFKKNLALSFVIGLAMFINLIVAGLVGSSIPLILNYLKIDPAIASSIFVTTCTDVFGFFCFLGLASLFINFL